MLELETIAARRVELDELAEPLAKQLAEVETEREKLAVVERVLSPVVRTGGADWRRVARPVQVAGWSVPEVPLRTEVPDASALPGGYQRMLSIVQAAGGPVMVEDVEAELGMESRCQLVIVSYRCRPRLLHGASIGSVDLRPSLRRQQVVRLVCTQPSVAAQLLVASPGRKASSQLPQLEFRGTVDGPFHSRDIILCRYELHSLPERDEPDVIGN